MGKKKSDIEKRVESLKQAEVSEKQALLSKKLPELESAPMKIWKDEKGELNVARDQRMLEHPLNKVMGCKRS